MADVQRELGRRQIWITRGHLAALGVATAFIALLAFFVGVKVGRAQIEAQAISSQAGFLPDDDQEDSLEALLREVERAQAENETDAPAVDDLSFAEDLTQAKPPVTPTETTPEEQVVTTTLPDEDNVPEAPEEISPAPPASGWSVQISSHNTANDADLQVARLKEQNFSAYRVEALINGITWYRVRVGAYTKRDKAEKAKKEMEELLNISGLLLVEAP